MFKFIIYSNYFTYVLFIGWNNDTPPVTPRSKNPPVDLARCKGEKSLPAYLRTAKKKLERTLGKSRVSSEV